nr:MAG TPA: hypothetical protein [Caudoviricetes sp.]
MCSVSSSISLRKLLRYQLQNIRLVCCLYE